MKETKKLMKSPSVLRLALAAVMVLMLAAGLVACSQPTTTTSDNTASAASVASEASAPAAESADAVTLQIFAANSLEKALPLVQDLYTAQHPEVTFADTQFKGSGDLVTALEASPGSADLLITASSSTMDTAVEQGSVDEATRIDMFGNDLIVVKPAGDALTIAALEDVNGDAITKVAIGEASAVPAGAYANQALFTIGLYSSESGKEGEYTAGFAEKVVEQSSVGNVAKTVASGDCQIGFVYTSDLYRYDGIETAFTIPADLHKAIKYPGAVVAGVDNADVAADFLDFCLTDPEALKIWQEYGFEVL